MIFMAELRKTALFSVHEKYNGRIVDFSGWTLPIQFQGIMAEHEAVRNAAGLFDVSHMGEVEVKGAHATEYVQHLVADDVAALDDNQILYTLMCYEVNDWKREVSLIMGASLFCLFSEFSICFFCMGPMTNRHWLFDKKRNILETKVELLGNCHR
jgi:glycine cleavage system aminomethyltransferase T